MNKPNGRTQFTIAAADLRVGLTTALAFAGTDDVFPTLTGIHFNAVGDAVDLVATDRYVASCETVKVAGAPHSFILPGDVAKQLLTLMPKPTRKRALTGMVTFAAREDKRVSASFIGDVDLSLTFTPIEPGTGSYPDVRKLIDESSEKAPETIPAVHFNPAYLARVMRVLAGRANGEPVRLSFTTPKKPVIVSHGESFRAVVMPVRKYEDGGAS
jgi:DNA polymerase III sliding clamp (beta) subunit (PCNA family)